MANLMARNVALKPAKKPRKSHVIKNAARGRECIVRIPGVCNGNSETVVLAHYWLAGECGTGSNLMIHSLRSLVVSSTMKSIVVHISLTTERHASITLKVFFAHSPFLEKKE